MTDPEEQVLTEIRGDLVLAALCVGQFHAPCQIEDDRLIVRADEGLSQALAALGLSQTQGRGRLTPAPLFVPEAELVAQAARTQSRRGVRTHVARYHGDDEDDPEPDMPATNA